MRALRRCERVKIYFFVCGGQQKHKRPQLKRERDNCSVMAEGEKCQRRRSIPERWGGDPPVTLKMSGYLVSYGKGVDLLRIVRILQSYFICFLEFCLVLYIFTGCFRHFVCCSTRLEAFSL